MQRHLASVMQDLMILGTAGNSIEILDAVIARNAAGLPPLYRVVGFLDDNSFLWGTSLHGVPILGGLSRVRERTDAMVINGIGSTRTRHRKPAIIEALDLPDSRFATVVHPSAVISSFATLGVGTAILQNVVVCSRARVGRHVQVLPMSIISHDTLVDDFATLAGGVNLSGNVEIGRACYIGTNASVREGVTIGADALVGMGATVLRNIPAGTVVTGVPARPHRAVVD